MKRLLGSMMMAVALLAACGGNVLVDGANGSGTGGTGGINPGPTTGAGAVTTTYTTSYPTTSTTVVTTTSTTAVSSSSSGGPCTMTCSEALKEGGILPCGGPALGAYNALLSCACSNAGPCQVACEYNFCLHEAVSPTCLSCLGMHCAGQLMSCN